MAGLSLNNDYGAQKVPPPQMQPAPNQQAFGNLPPQTAYANANKPMMPVTQQPNTALNNRPPMPPNSNPMPPNNNAFAPPPLPSAAANGLQQSQVPPSLNGSASQMPPQVKWDDCDHFCSKNSQFVLFFIFSNNHHSKHYRTNSFQHSSVDRLLRILFHQLFQLLD